MKNDMIYSTESELTYGRGYVYSIQYHIVWCTKYRKKILDRYYDEIMTYIVRVCDDLKIRIIACEIMPDHIHLLADCKPQIRPSDAVKLLKGNTARWLFMTHPEIKEELWGGHLWNPSYFITTVSERSREQVTHYIQTQRKE